MDYNIHLPEELKTLSKPKFKISNNTIIIYNGPFWDDWFFEAFIFLIILYMTLIQKLDLNNSYVIWFLVILFIYSFYCFSLNKVSIDFIEKKVTVVSYNPFINIYRDLFKCLSQSDLMILINYIQIGNMLEKGQTNILRSYKQIHLINFE